MRARTDRAYEFYSGAERMSKRIDKLSRLKFAEAVEAAGFAVFFSSHVELPCTPDDPAYRHPRSRQRSLRSAAQQLS
jgi:hypothetical protein